MKRERGTDPPQLLPALLGKPPIFHVVGAEPEASQQARRCRTTQKCAIVCSPPPCTHTPNSHHRWHLLSAETSPPI